MSMFLETCMLICFGLSWPINVYKNYKAKTARSMSLKFLMLIILGYVAGIAAKLITGNINYVLIVYVINLLIVSANVYVFFRNKHFDDAKKATHKNQVKHPITKEDLLMQIEEYRGENKTTGKGPIVFMGGTTFKNMDFDKSLKLLGHTNGAKNRSIAGLTIKEAIDAYEQIVQPIKPGRIFLNFGEADINDPDFNLDTFIEDYRWLLYIIRQKSKSKICIVSLLSQPDHCVNDSLKSLAKDVGCPYIGAANESELMPCVMSKIIDGKLSFTEAMGL